ncbi:MAG: membrane protein insertion efficiency factor YidD [Actinomycetota bacterium]
MRAAKDSFIGADPTGPGGSPADRARGVLWLAGRPFRALLLGLLGMYRALISPLLGARCRFHPSCSVYAEGAIRTHGAAKGLVLAVWRVLRCSPLTKGGVDGVPPRGAWRSSPAGQGYDAIIRQDAGEA